jgi:hypothetical protein
LAINSTMNELSAQSDSVLANISPLNQTNINILRTNIAKSDINIKIIGEQLTAMSERLNQMLKVENHSSNLTRNERITNIIQLKTLKNKVDSKLSQMAKKNAKVESKCPS